MDRHFDRVAALENDGYSKAEQRLFDQRMRASSCIVLNVSGVVK